MHFPNKSCKLAEFVGILLGDGNINSKGFVSVTLGEEDYAKNYVFKLINELFGISHFYVHPKGFFRVQTRSLPLVNYLLSLGLSVGNKMYNNITIPSWILEDKTYLRYCLKGLFDTDGSVFKHYKWSTIYFEYKIRSRSLLKSIYDSFLSLGFELTKLETERFYIKSNFNYKFLKEISLSNSKHLKRLAKFLVLNPALAQLVENPKTKIVS